jgi:hypothetical protein
MTENRPFIPYQTSNDLKRESQIIQFLSKKWNFDYRKMGDFSVFDFEVMRDNKIVAYIEVKTKTKSYKTFPTYICTKQDIDWGYQKYLETGIPAFVVVKWPDMFAYVKITHTDYVVKKSGQTNRNDPRDYNELCYFIPYSEFKGIGGFEFND